jgi:uncharacterized protein (TIRG00374 family)
VRHLHWLLLVGGAALLAVLVARNDPAAVAASIAGLSWRLLVVLCFPISLATLFDTLGWRFAFQHDRVPFRTLVAARLAGEAFNLTTATVGGEAVKAWLLRPAVPLHESLPSLIVSKTTITLAQGLFLLLGVALAWRTVQPESPVLYLMEVLLALEIVAVAGFVVTQVSGLVGWAGRLLARLGAPAGAARDTLARADDALVRFYRDEPLRLTLSIVFNLIGWLVGALEAYLILRFLGAEVSVGTATVIEAFGTAIRFATFLIPASLGAAEGGYLVTFGALGLGSTTAVSFSLVRRAREATWAAIGLIVFALLRRRRDPRTALSGAH